MPGIRADGAAEWKSGKIGGKKIGTHTSWGGGCSTGTSHGRRTTLGAWLKQRRKDLDLTQEALAEQVGCSVDMVRKVEAGAARPSRQFADLLGTQLEIAPGSRAAFVLRAHAGASRPEPGAAPARAAVVPSG